MSLGICITTTGGIVLAADSRQSYQNKKGVGRVGSDSAEKVFSLSNRVGLVVAGLAFLDDNGSPRNVSRYIEDFKRIHELNKLDVEGIAKQLVKFFEKEFKYKKQLEQLPIQIEANLKAQGMTKFKYQIKKGRVEFSFEDKDAIPKNGVAQVDGLHFIVAGYNSDGSHMACNISIPGDITNTRDSKSKGLEYGADWIGQTDVVSRIVLGVDGRVSQLPFLQHAAQKVSESQIKQQLQGLEYVIQWGAMTTQDAVDFSRLAIETTTSIQRFSDGIKMDPGDVPGVGGAIDVAFIGHDADFTWISRKELRAER